MHLVSIIYMANIEIILDNVAAFALEAVSIRASSGRTHEVGGERQRGPEGQLLRHSIFVLRESSILFCQEGTISPYERNLERECAIECLARPIGVLGSSQGPAK